MEIFLLQTIKQYDYKIIIMACVGIFFVGVLKFFKVFEKINKTNRKYIYAALSAAISVIAAAVYLIIIKQFNIKNAAVYALSVLILNQTIYVFYEVAGLRALLRAFGNLIINTILKGKINDTASLKVNSKIDSKLEKSKEEQNAASEIGKLLEFNKTLITEVNKIGGGVNNG